MKKAYINFGEFLLNHLNITNRKVDWDEIVTVYDQHEEERLIEAKQEVIDVEQRPGMIYINWLISEHYKLDPIVIREGKGRKRELVKTRQVCHFIMVELYKYTLEKVGEFYNKDHATILHGKRTVQNEMDTNKEYKRDLIIIINKLRDGSSNQGTNTNKSIGEIQTDS